MKAVLKLAIVYLIGLIAVSCAAKNAGIGADENSIAGILAKANQPLSKEQVNELKAFSPEGGREAFRAVYNIFNDKQLDALKEVYGSMQGRDGGPERPRFLFFAVLFENAGCPLTAEQLKAMKELPNERGAFRQMREMFNEKQSEVLQSMFNR